MILWIWSSVIWWFEKVNVSLSTLEITEMGLSAVKNYLSYFTEKQINRHVKPCHTTQPAHITVEKQDSIPADHFFTKSWKLLTSTISTVFFNIKSQREITLLNANSSPWKKKKGYKLISFPTIKVVRLWSEEPGNR